MSQVNFRTNILLKSIIGKDLITDDNVAVLELVKNSFDAGSKEVEIIFENTIPLQTDSGYKKKNNAIIIIKDSGSGMSEYDLINKWLNIAYSEKRTKKNQYNRMLAGNKGVGRFSCDRLGKELILYTKKKDNPLLKLSIDWTKFEKINDINKNIQDINFSLEEITLKKLKEDTNIDIFENGTILYIKNLREVWHADNLISLKQQLERFINPNQNFEADKFDIKIIAKEYLKYDKDKAEHQSINGIVKNRIFSKLDFKTTFIKAEISKDGDNITTTLTDRGEKIFTLIENNPFNLLKDIVIHIYYLNPYSKAYFTKQTGIRPVDFGSIFLFVNGFRIPPYGDNGNDWLGMEIRKGQGYNRYLGTREVIGRIEINNVDFDEDKEGFFIISNRSGVDNNKHFDQLTRNEAPFGYYYKTFRRLERFVVEGIKWDSSSMKETEIEKKVLNDDNWDESKEKFIDDPLERSKRLLSIIEKIINVKNSNIISLSINENFIEALAKEQTEKSRKEIDSIITILEDKNLTSEQISQLIVTLKNTEIGISNFPSENNEILSLLNKINSLKQKLDQGYKNKIEDEEKYIKLQRELDLEKEKNTYLRTSSRALSDDAKGLVHNIKITSKKISSTIDNLYYKIIQDIYKKNEILKSLGNIKFQAEKALKISKIITRSNFKTDKNEQIVDVVKYIEQYIGIYSDIYETTEMNFKIFNNNAKLLKKVSLLDIAIILDDLISNSEKAAANEIIIDMSNIDDNTLKIIFSDNGKGVNNEFLDDPEKIFELGITTTDGSGIGLYSVRTALKAIKGYINFLGNNILERGAAFEIIIDN